MNDSDSPISLAQAGLRQIEDAILRLLDANPQGLRNVDIARALGLSFEFSGRYKNHVTHGTLANLESRGLVSREENGKLFFSRNGDAPGKEAAQAGLMNIESAILQLLSESPQGLRNVDIANRLGLNSEFRGSYRNYLTYTVLMSLQNQGKVNQDSQTKLFTGTENLPAVE